MEKELTCIICPASCSLRVTTKDSSISVDGAMCPRGVEFAKREITNPARYVMSVVRVRNSNYPIVSVITRKPVPKDCIWQIVEKLADIEIEAPVEIGQVILSDICGTEIIATRRALKNQYS
ncbi:MAG: DUF1667 domain-containing protein [Desulfurococcaceae archaeon]